MKNLIKYKKYIKYVIFPLLIYILWVNTTLVDKTHDYIYNLSSKEDCKRYENKSALENWNTFKNTSNYTKFSAAYFLHNCQNKNWVFLSYKTLNPEFNIKYQENPLDVLKLKFFILYPFINNITYEKLEEEFKNDVPIDIKNKNQNEKNIIYRYLIIKKIGEDPGQIISKY